jgi:hypothetical protein
MLKYLPITLIFLLGCPAGKTGERIRYRKEAFEAAISTSDGWDYLPLWFHKLD